MRYAGEKKLNIWVAMALGILALFLLFVVYPLVLVLYKSVLSEDGNLSFAYFTKFFARKYYWSTLVNSFKVTIVSTVVAAVLGLAMAYVLRSVQIKGSKYLNILIVISYLSPPFIGAYAWIQLLGRNGFFTKILNSLFHIKLGGIYGFAGIVLVFSLQSFPPGVHVHIRRPEKPGQFPERGSRKPWLHRIPESDADHRPPGNAHHAGQFPAGVHARVL